MYSSVLSIQGFIKIFPNRRQIYTHVYLNKQYYIIINAVIHTFASKFYAIFGVQFRRFYNFYINNLYHLDIYDNNHLIHSNT